MRQSRIPRKNYLSRKFLIAALIQTGFLALVIGVASYFISNALTALQSQGMTTGFGFLDRARGWAFPVGVFTENDRATYFDSILTATCNTLLVGSLAIVVATIFGFLLGVAQTSSNLLLNSLSRGFVTIFRNIPTIIYVVFIFGAMLALPAPRAAISLFDLAYISNRGFVVPALDAPVWLWPAALIVLLAPIAILVVLRRAESPLSGRVKTAIWLGAFGCAVALVAVVGAAGLIAVDVPQRKVFDFAGGMRLPIEFVTLLLAVSLFGTSYIAEIVRGALTAVPQGMNEAGAALGLKPSQQFFYVRLPVALRAMVPAVSNQYLYMMKGTSLGAVIGYGDLFAVSSLSINYSGQTLEILMIMMAFFIAINFTLSKAMNALNAHLQFKRN